VTATLSPYLPAIFFIAWVAGGGIAGVVADRIVLRRVTRARMVERSYWLSVALHSLYGAAIVWGMAAGLYVALLTSNSNGRIQAFVGRVLLVVVLASVTYVAARFVSGAVGYYGRGVERRLLSASLFASVAQGIVIAVGALVVLSSLGIAITPLLTALGVGGLAVALALKDTLANLFSGIQIVASRQLRPGDYVKLENGFEGVVEDVNWRTTTIRELPNNLIVVPNEKLAQSIFTNYHLPDAQLTVSVSVGVGYGSDLEDVEKVALEAAVAALRDAETPVTMEPFVRFREFGDSSINLTVHTRVPEFTDQFRVRSFLIKRLYEGFGRAGIEIPFPHRVVTLTGA